MGVSTDEQIAYGVAFDEGTEFPWDTGTFDGDIENWWREIKGYKPPFKLYDDNGYIGEKRPPEKKITEYYNHRSSWDKANPIPVQLVNTCSCDYPMYMLAVRGTVKEASRGCPKRFEPTELVVEQENREALIAFMKEHSIEGGSEPGWYLSSYWG